MRKLLLMIFFPVLVFGQILRPDQRGNLGLWIKADSLGKTYSADAQVDSIRDWANAGEWFTQATAGNRPLYRTNVSPTGLPGIDFDGADDNLVNASSTAIYNTFNGTDWTFIAVFLLDAANEQQLFWHTNAGSSNNVGSMFSLTATGTFNAFITRGVGGSPTFDVTTTNQFDELDSVYYAVNVLENVTQDTLFIYMNGMFQVFGEGGTFNIGNTTVDATIGHATVPLNGKLLELIGFTDTLSDSDKSGIEAYIVDKWIVALGSSLIRRRIVQ